MPERTNGLRSSLPILHPAIHPVDPKQFSPPPAVALDLKSMGVNFFQILAVA